MQRKGMQAWTVRCRNRHKMHLGLLYFQYSYRNRGLYQGCHRTGISFPHIAPLVHTCGNQCFHSGPLYNFLHQNYHNSPNLHRCKQEICLCIGPRPCISTRFYLHNDLESPLPLLLQQLSMPTRENLGDKSPWLVLDGRPSMPQIAEILI